MWSNGDVTINSGGLGETAATKIILNIVLRVFKLEVKDMGNEDNIAVAWSLCTRVFVIVIKLCALTAVACFRD